MGFLKFYNSYGPIQLFTMSAKKKKKFLELGSNIDLQTKFKFIHLYVYNFRNQALKCFRVQLVSYHSTWFFFFVFIITVSNGFLCKSDLCFKVDHFSKLNSDYRITKIFIFKNKYSGEVLMEATQHFGVWFFLFVCFVLKFSKLFV